MHTRPCWDVLIAEDMRIRTAHLAKPCDLISGFGCERPDCS
jgi:hypothetical protein